MKSFATWATIAVLVSAGSLAAHHSLIQFDTTTPLRLKGTVVLFERINPHSIIFIDQKTDNGPVQRWSVIGPQVNALDRMRAGKDFLKAGDVIEVCGFVLKEGIQSQGKATGASMEGRPFNGHTLTMPDGKKWFWSDYGQIDKCLGAGETRESLMRRAEE
jgi:hypothetical protein